MAFHSSLTVENSDKIEHFQKTCLIVILGDGWRYGAALEMCGLKPLSDRRKDRCLDFARKCLKHPKNSRLFPLKPSDEDIQHDIRQREHFEVNFASKNSYMKSAIPYCQRLLNDFYKSKSN